MTSEPWKTIKFWLEICAAAYVVIGAVLQYSVMAVPFIPTILKYGWPLIAAYAAFRIFQFGRSLYQRFTRLELQVVEERLNVETRIDALAKSLQASREEVTRDIEKEIAKVYKKLDGQAHEREKGIQEVLREEIRIRESFSQEVSELKQLIASQAEQIVKLREKLVPPPKQEPAAASLADMLPIGLVGEAFKRRI